MILVGKKAEVEKRTLNEFHGERGALGKHWVGMPSLNKRISKLQETASKVQDKKTMTSFRS